MAVRAPRPVGVLDDFSRRGIGNRREADDVDRDRAPIKRGAQVRDLRRQQLVALNRGVSLRDQQSFGSPECLDGLLLGVGADGSRPRGEEGREQQFAGQGAGVGILDDLAGLGHRCLRCEAELGHTGAVDLPGEGGQGADQHGSVGEGRVEVGQCQRPVRQQSAVVAVADDPAVERRCGFEQRDDGCLVVRGLVAEVGEVHAQRLLGEEREMPPGVDEAGQHGAALQVDLGGVRYRRDGGLPAADVGDHAVLNGDGRRVFGSIALHREDRAVVVDHSSCRSLLFAHG